MHIQNIKIDSLIDLARQKLIILYSALFFIFCYLYIWIRIDPRLLYHRNPGLFLWDIEFFKSFLIYPGGIAEYISKFLLEFYYFGWAGAFVIVLLSFLICINYRWFLNNILSGPSNKIGVLFLIPAFCILNIYNRYSDISLVGLLFALVLANLYIRINAKTIWLKLISYIILSIIMHYIAFSYYWLFAALCVIWEVLRNRKYILASLYIGIEILLYLFTGGYILYWADRNILYYLFPYFSSGNLINRAVILALFLLFLSIFLIRLKSRQIIFAVILLVPISLHLWIDKVSVKILYVFLLLAPVILAAISPVYKARLESFIQKWGRVFLLFFIIVFFLALFSTFNKETASSLKIYYFSRNRMWEDVLREARTLSLRAYAKDRALYQKVFKALHYSGRLPYEQFNYPQSLLFNMPTPELESKRFYFIDLYELADTCFSLGLINRSELISFWALDAAKESVRATQQTALIYILRDNKKAAEVILRRIKKSLLYRAWAEEYLRLLDNDTLLAEDQYLMQAKERMIGFDLPRDNSLAIKLGAFYDYEAVFKRLLEENKNNKMAFEYLMSYYLLTGQSEKILLNISQLNNFGYKDIPYNYQEAILINVLETQTTNPRLYGKSLSHSLKEQYRYFYRVYQDNNYDPITTYNVLKDKYRNSYFLYYLAFTHGKKDVDKGRD